MGLDQYAYAAAKAGQNDEWWGQYDIPEDQRTVQPVREIAYWRKHPNLQGWMENLWESKGSPGSYAGPDSMFNGVELELTWEDLDRLERDINEGTVAQLETTGFFFGDASDDYYREQDLQFVKDAKAELFVGLKVFYNSSW